MQENKLKQLPNSVGKLVSLETLNLAGNSLKELPGTVSGLASLRSLDLRNNAKLKRLPVELAQCRCLETLVVDSAHLTFPSKEVVDGGTEAVMKFLCQGK